MISSIVRSFAVRTASPFAITTRRFSSTPAPRVAKMTIIGRLGAEPELVTTSNGQEIVKCVVGTSTGPRDNKQTSWWRVAHFVQGEGPQKDIILATPKGSLVYVDGNASMRKFERDGRIDSALSITTQRFEVLKRNDSEPSAEEAVPEE